MEIHAPRVGGDLTKLDLLEISIVFQSTPPVWGATEGTPGAAGGWKDFNPRPPCGGRPLGDHQTAPKLADFNPRPPCGGRRFADPDIIRHYLISIHAPRVGGDSRTRSGTRWGRYFNPRPPCGGRLTLPRAASVAPIFQSTPPVWGATRGSHPRASYTSRFQSTPPVWGATPGGHEGRRRRKIFQSTPPVWGAT